MVFEITVLGSSSALPTSKRCPSAHLLNSYERFFLIDCGEGTQMQLRRNKIKLSKVHDIFITHKHGDHIFGLYGLLSSLNLMGRSAPINLYAPAQFGQILQSHLADFDITLNFEINIISLQSSQPQKIFENKYITVQAIPLKHRVPTYGFVFKEKTKDRNVITKYISKYQLTLKQIVELKKGKDIISENGEIIANKKLTSDPPKPRSYAYISDTKYFERLASMLAGIDYLYHEATFANEHKKLAEQTAHSTAMDAALTAKKAGVGKLLIGHFSSRYKNLDVLLNQAKEIFPNTVVAEDNMKIVL